MAQGTVESRTALQGPQTAHARAAASHHLRGSSVSEHRRVLGRVRPKAIYPQSLELLQRAKALSPRTPTKSGLMVGLGETRDELLSVFADLRAHDVDVLTVGQYLRPSLRHLPVERHVPPAEFDELRTIARDVGFRHVESGPLVRSSYHAHAQLQ